MNVTVLELDFNIVCENLEHVVLVSYQNNYKYVVNNAEISFSKAEINSLPLHFDIIQLFGGDHVFSIAATV